LGSRLPEPSVVAALTRELEARRQGDRWRVRRTFDGAQGAHVDIDGRRVLAFASNDYLGLAGDPRLAKAARDATARYGVGAGASHLVSGHSSAHAALEDQLAAYVQPCPGARALYFGSGYLANLAILTALCGRGDRIVADKLNHACLNDGALLSRAQWLRYAHADAKAAAARLAGAPVRRTLIATDAVFSMDGDLAPLPALLELAEQNDALLVVDDAHGFGVLGEGRGTLAHFGLASPRIVYMGTLGKAAGVAGAFVAAHASVIETLVQTARAYIYTTAPPPLLAAALREALAIVRAEHGRRAHLFQLIERWRAGAARLPWRVAPSATPIQPLIVGDDARAVAVSEALWRDCIFVPAIRPPTVPAGTARLRVSLSAAHSAQDVERLLAALHAVAPGRAP
jgi:8-amino-7-oxononanoate synthase